MMASTTSHPTTTKGATAPAAVLLSLSWCNCALSAPRGLTAFLIVGGLRVSRLCKCAVFASPSIRLKRSMKI